MSSGKFFNTWNVNKLNRLPFLGYNIAWFFVFSILQELLIVDDFASTSLPFNFFILSNGEMNFGLIACFLLGLYVESLLAVQRLRDMGVQIAKQLGIIFTVSITVIHSVATSYLNIPLMLLNALVVVIFFLVLLFVPPE